ncbi:MAG: heme-binding protein [Candidatus Omnitrophica bacterium]|nr:heme-binding protein [Candidatus Omnitrophota bacterium]
MKQTGVKSFLLSFFVGIFLLGSVFGQGLVLQKESLTLELAKKIALACEAKAKDLGFSVGIVVLDEVGNLKLAYLMDKQSIISLEWAKAKALSSFEFKQPTNKGEFRVWNIAEKTMVLGVSGGFPLVYEKNLLGAIGVSGTKGKDDDTIASAGIEVFDAIFKDKK